MELDAEDKLRRARVQLQKDNPFFGYLVLHLELVEAPDKTQTAGVDFNGHLYYNPEFVEDLSKSQTKGLVCHEVMHLALKGKMRMGARKKDKWNVAQDIIINHIVKQNGFNLPDSGIIPKNGSIDVGDVTINDLDDQSFESVYDQLPEQDGQGGQGQGDESDEDGDSEGEGQGQERSKGFDDHIYEGENNSDDETGMDEEDFARAMAKARAHAKSQGSSPSGLEGRIEDIMDASVDWRSELLQYISNEVHAGWTWKKQHKRTRSLQEQGHRTTMPDTEKESLNVAVALDTSGSVSEEEIQQFLGEVCGLLNAFEAVNLTLIKHTADVYDVEHYDDPDESQFTEISVKSGGTDHRPVFKELEDNWDIDADLLINFTDGYTTAPPNQPFGVDTVWAVDNHDVGKNRLNFGKILRVEGLMAG